MDRGSAETEWLVMKQEMETTGTLANQTAIEFEGWSNPAEGSMAEDVVRHGPCPGLTVREKDHNFLA